EYSDPPHAPPAALGSRCVDHLSGSFTVCERAPPPARGLRRSHPSAERGATRFLWSARGGRAAVSLGGRARMLRSGVRDVNAVQKRASPRCSAALSAALEVTASSQSGHLQVTLEGLTGSRILGRNARLPKETRTTGRQSFWP